VKIAVVFDTPYGLDHENQLKRMDAELANKAQREPEAEYQIANALRSLGHEVRLLGLQGDLGRLLDELRKNGIDLVFNCTEAFAKNPSLDYVVASTLEASGYKYTGAPPLSLLLTRNKALSKKLLSYHGIRVPGFVTYEPGEPVEEPYLGFPLIVKPLELDASEGIAMASVVRDVEALRERVVHLHDRFHQPAIAEEFIEGREIYVSVLGNGSRLEILPLTEMIFDKDKTRPEERIATQSAKWDEPYRRRRGIKNVMARPISKNARAAIEETCRIAYRALCLRDYGRMDLRLTEKDEVWFIEANANPYLADGHEVASSAKKAGMSYEQLIQRIVTEAAGDVGSRTQVAVPR
jgi:D-alanine-D-alanine ligase